MGAWLGGCDLQWSVLGLCILLIDFLSYILWCVCVVVQMKEQFHEGIIHNKTNCYAPGIEGWKTLDGQRIICQRRTIALSESAG